MKTLFFGKSVWFRALILLAWFAGPVWCAQVEPAEYERLLSEARKKGVAPALVTLENLTLIEIGQNPEGVRAALTQKMAILLAELGDTVMKTGRWNNGLGHAGFYVTPEGLALLSASAHAETFRHDSQRFYRVHANDDDGSLDVVEAILDGQGFADVEIFLNVEDVDFDIDRQGATLFRPGEKLCAQMQDAIAALKGEAFLNGIHFLNHGKPPASGQKPSFRARIDRETFYGLKESLHVRRIHPLDFVDPRPAYWGPEVLDEARVSGSARVMIALRGGAFFSGSGWLSEQSGARQDAAMLRAFEDILKNAGTSIASPSLTCYPGLKGCFGNLPYSVLARLYDNADPRILNIDAEMVLTTNAHNLMNRTPGPITFGYDLRLGDDVFRNGSVFVAFRLRSRPDVWWLLNRDNRWSQYDAGLIPAYYSGILPPVTHIPILSQPTDVSAFLGDGEFWVGWGFSEVSAEAAFQEMLDNGRCKMVWLIGEPQGSDRTLLLYSAERGVRPSDSRPDPE